jgi:Ras-related GTP-binding protein C/D
MPQTETLEIHHVQNNAFVNLEVWDFPGEYTLSDSAVTDTKTLSDINMFDQCGALVYVIDIGTYESSDDVIPTLVEWLTRAYNANPKIHFAVLLHKFDAEKQTSDFAKSDIIDELDKQVQNMFRSLKIESYDDMNIDYHLTSIYDHTLFELFSQIVQTLFEEHTVLEDLLNVLVEKCDMDKAFLFDVASKIYIAENPPALVDSDKYELSADMIDVVIDVLCIYGSDDDGGGVGFDSEACSVIHLNGNTREEGDVLYLRQVSSELAVVCILREENFTSKGLVDYNIEMFKKALDSVVQIKKSTENMDVSTKTS